AFGKLERVFPDPAPEQKSGDEDARETEPPKNGAKHAQVKKVNGRLAGLRGGFERRRAGGVRVGRRRLQALRRSQELVEGASLAPFSHRVSRTGERGEPAGKAWRLGGERRRAGDRAIQAVQQFVLQLGQAVVAFPQE